MPRGKYLDKRAQDIIMARIRETGEMTTAEIMDLIRPHYLFDAQEAREQGVKRQANRLVRKLKDDSGIRTCFALRDENVYINIEKCQISTRIGRIEKQLQQQINGLRASRNKARRRKQELDGQMSLEMDQA